jgi:hypothetical protein
MKGGDGWNGKVLDIVGNGSKEMGKDSAYGYGFG